MGAAGSAAIGLVWGWLLGSLRRPLRNLLPLVAATMLVCAEVVVFAAGRGLLLFSLALPTSIGLHRWWRRFLSRRILPTETWHPE
jgi:hypothetical protein